MPRCVIVRFPWSVRQAFDHRYLHHPRQWDSIDRPRRSRGYITYFSCLSAHACVCCGLRVSRHLSVETKSIDGSNDNSQSLSFLSRLDNEHNPMRKDADGTVLPPTKTTTTPTACPLLRASWSLHQLSSMMHTVSMDQ